MGRESHSRTAVAKKAPGSQGDPRRFPRFVYQSPATVQIQPSNPGEKPKCCPVLTQDLSRGGVKILLSQRLFPGQRVTMLLHSEKILTMRVIWCHRLCESVFLAGCQFRRADSGD
jgi:hypothetical protein